LNVFTQQIGEVLVQKDCWTHVGNHPLHGVVEYLLSINMFHTLKLRSPEQIQDLRVALDAIEDRGFGLEADGDDPCDCGDCRGKQP
jgi:hypothetical protein